MATTPFTVEQFGGLNAATDPFELGPSAACDLVNVDFDTPGRVRCRDGHLRIQTPTTLTGAVYENMVSYEPPGGDHVVVGYRNGGTPTLTAYTSIGAFIASTTATGSVFTDSARGTTGSTQYLYFANSNNDTLRRWDGTSFTSPAGMPKADFLSQIPTSGRLVASDAATTSSRLLFSDPFNAESWNASNYIDLNPGDGFITAMESWQDRVFVFKQHQFFVFYGESIDADGGAIFNYRTVDRYGAWNATAGDEGVYFWDGQSVWLTTGDAPVRVSKLVDPVLRGRAPVNGETVNGDYVSQHRLSYADGRLYISMYTLSGAYRTLVYDPKFDAWTYWTLNVRCAVTIGGFATVAPVVYCLSTLGIEAFDGAVTDNGTPISWSYKSGRYPLTEPGQVAITRESSLFGSGTVTLRLDTDLYSDQSGTVTLGTAPAVAEGWPAAVDQEGTWLQHTLSGTGAASVSRLTHYVSSAKPVGVR